MEQGVAMRNGGRREMDQAESCKQAHDQEWQGRVEAASSRESESRRQRHQARIHFTLFLPRFRGLQSVATASRYFSIPPCTLTGMLRTRGPNMGMKPSRMARSRRRLVSRTPGGGELSALGDAPRYAARPFSPQRRFMRTVRSGAMNFTPSPARSTTSGPGRSNSSARLPARSRRRRS